MSFVKKFSLSEKWVIFLVCLCFHLWKIGGDLPYVYNPDEPHNLNIAGYFLSGHFVPLDFKYPMLWTYFISIVFGILFVFSKIVRIVGSAQDFARWYLLNPTAFYLAARGLSAVLISLAPVILYRCGLAQGRISQARLMALFCILSPSIIHLGSDATVYSALIFFTALYLQQMHDLYFRSSPKSYLTAGVALGLLYSTHFIAAPLGLILLGNYLIKTKRMENLRWVLGSFGTAAAIFLILNPFVIIHFPTFYSTIRSYRTMQQTPLAHSHFWEILKNAWSFLDLFGMAATASAIGFFFSPKNERRFILILLIPFLVCLPYQSISLYGNFFKYSIPTCMPFILIASFALPALFSVLPKRQLSTSVLLGLIFIPSLVQGIAEQIASSETDTRTISKKWIETNIPSGSKILIFDPFLTPQLHMSKTQINRLYERSLKLKHPRTDYYRILLTTDFDRTYEIYVIKRTSNEHEDTPERAEKSYQAQDVIDPEDLGFKGIRVFRIQYLVVDEHLLLTRGSAPWLKEAMDESELVFKIEPQIHKIKGPPLLIYKLPT